MYVGGLGLTLAVLAFDAHLPGWLMIPVAMIGAALGYPVELVIPANVSVERKRIIEAYGAKTIESDPLQGSDGAILLCREIIDRDPDRYFKPDQYNNPANWQAHRDTTAPEIWAQTRGRVTHFVATMGTSGTVMGTGRGLKAFNPRDRKSTRLNSSH